MSRIVKDDYILSYVYLRNPQNSSDKIVCLYGDFLSRVQVTVYIKSRGLYHAELTISLVSDHEEALMQDNMISKGCAMLQALEEGNEELIDTYYDFSDEYKRTNPKTDMIVLKGGTTLNKLTKVDPASQYKVILRYNNDVLLNALGNFMIKDTNIRKKVFKEQQYLKKLVYECDDPEDVFEVLDFEYEKEYNFCDGFDDFAFKIKLKIDETKVGKIFDISRELLEQDPNLNL